VGAARRSRTLPADRLTEIADAIEPGRIATCLPFLLEARYSARNARDHDAVLAELLALPHFSIDTDVERGALDDRRQLARIDHHRLPPVDLLVADLADRYELGVLHYDRDYDLLADKTGFEFDSVWLARAGTL
jgi:predicted nucleic acid-binding protein